MIRRTITTLQARDAHRAYMQDGVTLAVIAERLGFSASDWSVAFRKHGLATKTTRGMVKGGRT